jgi:hypothetical protein
MGAVTVKATAISNADQLSPKISSASYLGKSPVFGAVGTLAVGASDSAGSIYRFCRVPSGSRIHRMDIFSDAISGFSSATVGLYDIQDASGNAGAVVSGSLFASGVDLSVAQTEPYDVLFNNLSIANMEKRVWELLGLTADPFKFYDVSIVSVTQSGAAGNLSMSLEFVI